jgi:ABC-type amino acid transport substrate-binding protein
MSFARSIYSLRRSLMLVVAATTLFSAFTASAQESNDTLKKIRDTGIITFGHRESSFGFSYIDGDKPVGYSMDICARILQAIKAEKGMPALEVRLQLVTSQNRIPLVVNGTVDLECGTTTNLIERQKSVAFSPDIFRYNVRMAVKANSGIRSITDLSGKQIVTTAGTTSFRLLKEAEKGQKIDAINVFGKDHAESFLLLESGRAAAFILDDILLAGLIGNSKNPKDYVIVGESLRTENQSLMYRKDDPKFKALVDRVVGGMMKSGEMDKLYAKWFMSPIPPKNMNINYPINAETREAFKNPSSKGI